MQEAVNTEMRKGDLLMPVSLTCAGYATARRLAERDPQHVSSVSVDANVKGILADFGRVWMAGRNAPPYSGGVPVCAAPSWPSGRRGGAPGCAAADGAGQRGSGAGRWQLGRELWASGRRGAGV